MYIMIFEHRDKVIQPPHFVFGIDHKLADQIFPWTAKRGRTFVEIIHGSSEGWLAKEDIRVIEWSYRIERLPH